jgi:hypothetical protein
MVLVAAHTVVALAANMPATISPEDCTTVLVRRRNVSG